MAEINKYSLRPEAGPVPYWKHHKRAKEALNFIIRVLKAAADTVQESKEGDGDLAIDTNRASRIVFVSGEPGSGKSTLYLTLRAMLSAKDKGNYRVGYKGKDRVNLNDLKEVRWLDPLDLEVAGDEGENLLAAVLVRLFRALDESSIVHSKNCEDAIKELEELASDIGIAWEGNLQARAGALDPATYSEEVMRTQRARLGINERLRSALDKLAEKECYGCSSGTLFVLPVDDFYLKPDASLQLLRLLRMISIPRLFFLVMGDITTVEALFIEKSLADWTAVAGTSLFANRSDRLDDALSRARELRARYLRKLLPPGQRATIEAMDWYEALDFELSRSDGSSDSILTLEQLLNEVKLDASLTSITETKNETLLDFLISPPFDDQEREEREKRVKDDPGANESAEERARKKDRSAYTALQILDATPREMMDFGSALREVIRKQHENESRGAGDDDAAPILLSCVMDFVNLVTEEQNFLNEREQEILMSVLPTRHYYLEDINFEMNRLRLQPAPWPWKDIITDKLWVRKHRSWDLTVDRTFIKGSKTKRMEPSEHQFKELITKVQSSPFAKLPPRPAAWIVLLHDLAWEWSNDSVTGNLVERLCREFTGWTWPNPHETDQKLDPSVTFPGWAVWRDGPTYKHFPIPELKTVRDLDRFLRIWSLGLEWLGSEQSLDKFIDLWEFAGWIVIDSRFEQFESRGTNWFEDQIKIYKKAELNNNQSKAWLDTTRDFRLKTVTALSSKTKKPRKGSR